MPYVHQLLQSDPLMQNRESEVKAKDKESILESLTMGMDWGTVLVYSCEKDCDDGTGLFTSTEYAAVQLELN